MISVLGFDLNCGDEERLEDCLGFEFDLDDFLMFFRATSSWQ